MRLADTGNRREYNRVSLRPEHLTEIHKLFLDTNEPITYKFDDYLIESVEDIKELTQARRRPKRIYVHTRALSLSINPSFTSVEAHSDTDLRVFVAIDSLILRNCSFWSTHKRFGIFALVSLLLGIMFVIAKIWSFNFVWPLIVGFVIIQVLYAVYNYWESSHVHIKWPRQTHWFPNPSQVIASVLTVLITAPIIFLTATYLSPWVKPYLDWLLIGAPYP